MKKMPSTARELFLELARMQQNRADEALRLRDRFLEKANSPDGGGAFMANFEAEQKAIAKSKRDAKKRAAA